MDIGPGHWVFAGLFALVFLTGIIYAYRDDLKRTPDLFKGSSKFLLIVTLLLMVLIVIKILHRLSQ